MPPAGRLTEAAHAKINLTLRVVGRRADGYHLLDSLVAFAGAADCLAAEAEPLLALALDGPFAAGLAAGPDNLVLRAARALADAAGIPPAARLVLTKNLPVASGIGGGSADAAAALRLLARLWSVTIAPERMADIAAGLGADVPVCLASRSLRMRGIGERLSAAPDLPACGIALVNPGAALATAAVFRALDAGFSAEAELPEAWPDAAVMARDLAALGNDLEPPACRLCPPIGDVIAALRAMPRCLLARMSGSGATCFGLFPDAAAASRAAASLAVAEPGWWCWGGGLYARSPPGGLHARTPPGGGLHA